MPRHDKKQFPAWLTRLLLSSLLLSLCACFRMGIPEVFSSVDARSTRGFPPRAVVVTPRGQEADSSVGYQFVLGLFPFTRVFLEHGPQTLLHELLIDQLQVSGFEVYSNRSAPTQAEALKPELLIQPTIESFSLNAYDGLFFRLRSLAIEAKVPPLGAISLSKKEVAKSAHAPELARFAEERIQFELRALLERHRSPRARKRKELVHRLLLLPPPELSFASEQLGSTLARSYGFASVRAYDNARIARIMQRGLEQAAHALKLEAYSINGYSEEAIPPGAWLLYAEVLKSEFLAESLQLRIQFNLRERSGALIRASECEANTPFVTSGDGRTIKTLERAFSEITTAFLSEQSSEAAKCS